MDFRVRVDDRLAIFILVGVALLSLVGITVAQSSNPGHPWSSINCGAGCINSNDIADGTIRAVDIRTSEVQARVTGTCPAGQSIRTIYSGGGVACEVDDVRSISHQRFQGTCSNTGPNPTSVALASKATYDFCVLYRNMAHDDNDNNRIQGCEVDYGDASNFRLLCQGDGGETRCGMLCVRY